MSALSNDTTPETKGLGYCLLELSQRQNGVIGSSMPRCKLETFLTDNIPTTACKSAEKIKIANWLLSLQKNESNHTFTANKQLLNKPFSLEPKLLFPNKQKNTDATLSFRARKRRRKKGTKCRGTTRFKSSASGCNCKNSGCLKLYCECFAKKVVCKNSCRCRSCRNTEANIQERDAAIKAIIKARPNAFAPKTVCSCRRSHCRKGYCTCFSAGVKCGPNCSCVGCENTADSDNNNDNLGENAGKEMVTTPKPNHRHGPSPVGLVEASFIM